MERKDWIGRQFSFTRLGKLNIVWNINMKKKSYFENRLQVGTFLKFCLKTKITKVSTGFCFEIHKKKRAQWNFQKQRGWATECVCIYILFLILKKALYYYIKVIHVLATEISIKSCRAFCTHVLMIVIDLNFETTFKNV